MNRRIILHVGSPKCGSTFLQRVMHKNADTLLAHGIRYPAPPEAHPGNAGDLKTIDRDRYEAMFADDVHTVVLSHEDLYSKARTADALVGLAQPEGTEIQVVAFLRPFSDFLFGDYSQLMKQNFDRYLQARRPYDGMTFRDLIDRRVDKLDPARFLSNWQARVKTPPVHVAGHRDIRPVMEGLLGADMDLDWTVERHTTNPSLRMEDCDRIAEAMRRPDVSDETIKQMFIAAFHRTGRPDSGRNAARRRVIEGLFEDQNAAIEARFGYDNRLPPEKL